MQRLMVAIVSLFLWNIPHNSNPLSFRVFIFYRNQFCIFISSVQIIMHTILKSSRMDCSLNYRSISLPHIIHNFFCFIFYPKSSECQFFTSESIFIIEHSFEFDSPENWRFILKFQFRYYIWIPSSNVQTNIRIEMWKRQTNKSSELLTVESMKNEGLL